MDMTPQKELVQEMLDVVNAEQKVSQDTLHALGVLKVLGAEDSIAPWIKKVNPTAKDIEDILGSLSDHNRLDHWEDKAVKGLITLDEFRDSQTVQEIEYLNKEVISAIREMDLVDLVLLGADSLGKEVVVDEDMLVDVRVFTILVNEQSGRIKADLKKELDIIRGWVPKDKEHLVWWSK
jgi:hypothetical protein